jgi:kumamolisin
MAELHVPLPGSRRPAPEHGVRVKDVDAHVRLDITVTLKGPALPPPSEMPAQAMNQEQIESKYGVAPEDLLQVERVLGSFGLQVREVKQGGRSLRMTGPASAVEAAFEPNLGLYRVPGQGLIRAREGMLVVPKELDGLITGVFGLDQRRVADRHSARRSVGTAVAAQAKPLTPEQLRRHYGFPAGQGKGKTIAIAEFGTPLNDGTMLPPAYIGSDVAAFCQKNKLDTPPVSVVSVGVSPLDKAQFDNVKASGSPLFDLLEESTLETMMDVEIVAGLCPKATIKVYFAPWSEGGWIDMIDDATSGDAPPVALSVSYGLFEEATDWSQGALDRINHRLQLAAMRGVTICVSSGDDGTGCGTTDGRCHTEFPASSPFVLAVGGTQFDEQADGKTVEVAWRTAPGWRKPRTEGASTGGGVSRFNERPAWQDVRVKSLNKHATDGRIVPDVAALAGAPFYDLVFDGQPAGGGGTSAATPLWAGLIALIDAALPNGKQQRFVPRLLYRANVEAEGFIDVTSGNNASMPSPGIGYGAAAGFDAVTGWGVPNGATLLDALGKV